jgi:TM2 domain-containing membrane protein YozV
MKDLLTFDTMLTPKIITIIYFLTLAGVLIAGVAALVGGQILAGILTIVFGAIVARVYCEILIVVFKMNEALQELRKK